MAGGTYTVIGERALRVSWKGTLEKVFHNMSKALSARNFGFLMKMKYNSIITEFYGELVWKVSSHHRTESMMMSRHLDVAVDVTNTILY